MTDEVPKYLCGASMASWSGACCNRVGNKADGRCWQHSVERPRTLMLADGREVLNRTARRLGGKDSSQVEREPAMEKFRTGTGETRDLGWKWQCRCGSTEAKKYRSAWWCPGCGREKLVVL